MAKQTNWMLRTRLCIPGLGNMSNLLSSSEQDFLSCEFCLLLVPKFTYLIKRLIMIRSQAIEAMILILFLKKKLIVPAVENMN